MKRHLLFLASLLLIISGYIFFIKKNIIKEGLEPTVRDEKVVNWLALENSKSM